MIKKRNEMDSNYQWNLTTLYKTDDDWEKSYNNILAKVDSISKYQGKLGDSATTLHEAFEKTTELRTETGKLYVYSGLKHHQDTQEPTYQAMSAKAETLYIKLSTATSFINSELLDIPKEKIESFFLEEESLSIYKHFFDNLWREKEHILSPDKEELLARAFELSTAPSNIFSMINNADIKFEPAKDKDGNEVTLSHGNFIRQMQNTDRVLRKNAFDNYYASFIAQKNTIAETYASSVKSDVFFSTVRGYNSALESALSDDNIPKELYKNLINTVNKNLNVFHRYMSVRKKALGLDDLNIYDIYVPLVKNADTKILFDDAKEKILKGLEPLGAEYLQVVNRAFNEKWIDVYENENKRAGAYSWGTYGTNPFILMNYTDTVNDMFTLAHELGHSMHSHYSKSEQPYIYSDYTIFVAEIASTVNEALLMDYLLNTITDKTMQKYLINYFIEMIRGSFFRQTMFAEFEMLTHEMIENNEPLTSDVLNKTYFELVKKYFGPEVELDEKIQYEWSRVPHFYNAFYVFQYSTGIASAMAISKAILDGYKTGDTSARDAYIEMLKSGSNDYSIELLKKAGVDMTTAKPIEDTAAVFSDLLDKFEKALEE